MVPGFQSCFISSNQFDIVLLLFFLAIVAFQQSFFFVSHVEPGLHRFVVGDTFRIVALHDTFQFIGHDNLLLFHHLVIADDVQLHVRSND